MGIKDDISLFNWIPHLAVQFSNELMPDLRWPKTMAQYGEDDVKSFVKLVIPIDTPNFYLNREVKSEEI